MVEPARGPAPIDLVVTVGAGAVRELATVRILMTTRAVPAEPEEGPREILGRRQGAVPDERRLVAVTTPQVAMGALQAMAGEGMVEGIAPPVAPPDQFELATMVLDVAGGAVLVIGTRVQSTTGSHPAREGLVTRQTTVGTHSPPGIVAIEASGCAFEFGMRLGELARRELRLDSGGEEEGRGQGDNRRRDQPNCHAYPVPTATAMWITMKRYMTMAKGLWKTCQ